MSPRPAWAIGDPVTGKERKKEGKKEKQIKSLYMVVHACNLSTQEAETARLPVRATHWVKKYKNENSVGKSACCSGMTVLVQSAGPMKVNKENCLYKGVSWLPQPRLGKHAYAEASHVCAQQCFFFLKYLFSFDSSISLYPFHCLTLKL